MNKDRKDLVTEKMAEAAARVLNKRLAEENGLHGVSRDMIEAALAVQESELRLSNESCPRCHRTIASKTEQKETQK
ncbi:hypothetical protein [Sinorhizobium sp. BJ1]|uniref:hypothetical protein n=1 Tax=Sinorhizobium sp. BJ1 TaxID=2035455 RepID=UPI000BE800CE|nr:hypothetical protein [Sinorhizobium sp. BJ1]PDT86528.1 hypothetical protein CO676_02235 [Sinorhizobium sp. BJ1]